MTAEKPTMHIDPFERKWIIASAILLVIFIVAITVTSLAGGIAVPSPVARVNPQTVDKEGPFANPGLRELAPGKYEAFILSQIWSFTPREITVPAGSSVTFYVTARMCSTGSTWKGPTSTCRSSPARCPS